MEHSFDLTPHLIEALKQLDNAYAEAYVILQSSSREDLQNLQRCAHIGMIGGPSPLKGKDIGEIEAGYRAMRLLIYDGYKDLAPLKETDIQELHRTLMAPRKEAFPCRSQYKAQSSPVIQRNQQTGESRITFQANGARVASAVEELVGWYNEALPLSPWTVVIASEFACRFLAINPFQEGNEQLGRGLFLLALLQSPSTVIATVSKYLAIDSSIERHKEGYCAVLDHHLQGQCHQNPQDGKVHSFVKFMVKILQEAIDGMKVARQKIEMERKLSERALRVLDCFKEQAGTRLTTAKLMSQTGLPRRTIIYALNTLLESQFIQKYGQGAGVQYQLTI